MRALRIVYDLLFLVFSILYIPVFLIRLSQAPSRKRFFLDRLGFLPKDLSCERKHPRIWIHAVSVGETLAIRTFVKEVYNRYPEADVLVSTITPTGQRIAQRQLPGTVRCYYLPLDISFITNAVVQMILPDVLILVETELWPNLIVSCKKYAVPVCVLNGRISPRSFRGYYKLRSLSKQLLSHIDLFMVQNDDYKRRCMKLGVSQEQIVVTGSLKYDLAVCADGTESVDAWKATCGFSSTAKIIIAASTHDPEEKLILEIFQKLRLKYADIVLIIAPRHIERSHTICDQVRTEELTYRLFEDTQTENKNTTKHTDVLIINTIGQLARLYQYADVVFMGGSLIAHGGQNPLEAALYKKPIVTGPCYFNFKEIYTALASESGAYIAQDINAICEFLERCLKDTVFAHQMGERACEHVRRLRGASKKSVDVIANRIFAEKM